MSSSDLPNSKPGSSHGRGAARGLEGGRAVEQEVAHLGHDVVVALVGVVVALRAAAHVHHDGRCAVLCGDLRHLGIDEAGHVVEPVDAGGGRGARDLRGPAIDR